MALKGYIGFKGERGYSAYEVAVKNGFIGTEQDWLATLGTSSHFARKKTLYTTQEVGETEIALPNEYSVSSFVDIYIEGEYLDSGEYTIEDRKVVLETPIDVVGTKVETVVINMSTNELPIITAINSSSTNKTTPGTKAVYDLVNPIATTVTTLVENVSELNEQIENKFEKSNIATVTGEIKNIAAGEISQVDVSYPIGFNKDNCTIIAKLVSSTDVYYNTNNCEQTTNGFPEIYMIALNDSAIKVWMKNSNNTDKKDGYFKITLMKI